MKHTFDPTTLEIYRALFTSVAEEMGVALRRTGFSPNIKERRDYSCVVFDAKGHVISQGDHMLVHLGSMSMAVAAALAEIEFVPGDVVAVNDPFAGGTHLPDVTLIMPVAIGSRTLFYVATRAHHADIGGATPGSMGLATDIYGEGLRIPPIRLVRNGILDRDTMRLLLANVRGNVERRGDFDAQIGSLKTGATRLLEIVERLCSDIAIISQGKLLAAGSLDELRKGIAVGEGLEATPVSLEEYFIHIVGGERKTGEEEVLQWLG